MVLFQRDYIRNQYSLNSKLSKMFQNYPVWLPVEPGLTTAVYNWRIKQHRTLAGFTVYLIISSICLASKLLRPYYFKVLFDVIIKISFKISFPNVPFPTQFVPLHNQQVKPPTVVGQFHTLFFGSVRMFFLGVLGFAVYGNEALHFSCEPDKREINLFCYNQFRPITPQVSVPVWTQTLTP